MSDTREVIRRINEEIYGQGRVELVDELYHDAYVNHTAPPGVPPDRSGEKGYVQMLHEAVSDPKVVLERVLIDGDQVAWRWAFRATHTGEFMGVPASGNELEVTGNDLGVMRDGKLAELWMEIDMLSVMTQMGAMEASTG